MADYMFFEFAIYYLPEPELDPLVELKLLLAEQFTDLQLVDEFTPKTNAPIVAARVNDKVATTYTPPALDSLRYFGRGLSREQAVALQDSKSALVLRFSHPKSHVWSGMRSALRLTEALARRTDGLIWDEETREVFTPDYWRDSRLETWTESFPDISKHITIHAYRETDLVRAISLGMVKFGLPDLVVENFSWSHNRPMGNLMNSLAQAIAEGLELPESGKLDFDIRGIKTDAVRQSQLDSLLSNATGVGLLKLTAAKPKEGDPLNVLLEIGFERYSGPDLHSQQEQLLSSLFGSQDSISPVQHNEALEAASQRARTKLPELRGEFDRGLPPGEFLLLKAPFDTQDGGHEWMWVEVIEWNSDKIKGLLKNEPFNIPDLHAGQMVEISEADVFDYLRTRADGTVEGNETGKLIKEMTEGTQTGGN
jgi:hypothetical protein